MQNIQKFPTVTSLQLQQGDPGLEKEKKSIYSHPLYPLLSLLLEKCEQTTSSSDLQFPETFEADLQFYVQRHEANDKIFLTDNEELDSLIIKAIQVLRIHLNELRKVNELCRDFCTRYINCLKSKILQESMFDDSEDSSLNGSEILSPNVIPCAESVYNIPYSLPRGSMGRTYLEMNTNSKHQHRIGQLNNMGHTCNTVMNGISVDCVEYMNGTNRSPPLSGISVHDEIIINNYNTSTVSSNSGRYNNLIDISKQKRGALPKKATQIMKQWLFQHLVHPYPTEDEKRQIANQINLTLLQVNNWFINARRRILQPMLDSSGLSCKEKSNLLNSKHDKSDSISESEDTSSTLMYSSSCSNRKKKSATNRPSNNRFWPASLASAVTILSGHQNINMCTPNFPIITTATSQGSTPKVISQLKVSNNIKSRKRSKTDSSDFDIYQPTKVFSPIKESYDSYIAELDFKFYQKDSKSQTDTSTPQYTDLSSPNNSKSNSLDDIDITRSGPLCLPSTNLHKTNHTSPKDFQDIKNPNKPNTISSYLSSHHDMQPVNILPSNSCSAVSSNSYPHIIMPQTNYYTNPPPMLHNSSLNPAVQQNNQHLMSSALFNICHSNPHSFHMYDSVYSNYEHLVDKNHSMTSHINDLLTTTHGLNRSFEKQMSIKIYDDSPNFVKDECKDSMRESRSFSNHFHTHLDTFPNFKVFHSKTNIN